jgi:hypothetical protein
MERGFEVFGGKSERSFCGQHSGAGLLDMD